MIPLETGALEEEHHHYGKDSEGNNLLDYFQLYDIEGTPVGFEADPVGGYKEAIFDESHSSSAQRCPGLRCQ